MTPRPMSTLHRRRNQTKMTAYRLASTLGCFGVLIALSGCGAVGNSPSGGSPAGTGSGATQAATLEYPREGGTIDPFQPFKWNGVSNATAYVLSVGTSQGAQDIFSVSVTTKATGWWVDNLLPGPTYYARLTTVGPGGSESYVDVSFQAAAMPMKGDRASFYATIAQSTANVRLSANLANKPVPGSLLATEVELRGNAAAVCTDYAATLVEVLQQNQIYARPVALTQFGGLASGHSVAEYYDPFLGKWSVADATFGAIYFKETTQEGQSASELSNLVFLESWDQIHPQFVTNYGSLYMTHYYLDPITYFLNVVIQGETPAQSLVHDPKQFLVPVVGRSGENHGSFVFLFSSSSENADVDNPPGVYSSAGSISILPFDNLLWSNTFTLNDGWSVNGPSDMQAFTFRRVMF